MSPVAPAVGGWRRVALAAAAAFAVGAAAALPAAQGALLAPVDPAAATRVLVTVPAGASTREVAELLYRERLIRHPLAFRFYARSRGLDGRLQAGDYWLSPAMSAAEILDKLARGDAVVYRFTVPEGFTVVQVAELLAQKGVAPREAFLAAARQTRLVAEFLPAGAPLVEPLEGYLFPATYDYRPGVAPDALVAAMVGRLREVLAPLMPRIQELGLTVHQVLTLASIVEREAKVPAERARIAGVYWNRLREGMPLQADPTVRYALGLPPEVDISLQDLATDHPYNTYRHLGLPPGPIANPGEASIRAVLWPERHDYLYFVAKGDGSGEHLFSRTYAEHQQAMALAEAQRRTAQDGRRP